MKRHNDERDYECETCGKKFFERQDLRHHERIHTGVKPHKCPYCPYTCAIRGNLNKHLKHKHEQDNYLPVAGPQTGLNTMSYDPYVKRLNNYMPIVSHVIKRPGTLKHNTANNKLAISETDQVYTDSTKLYADTVKAYTETNQFVEESPAKEHVEEHQRSCVSDEERYYTNLQRVATEEIEVGSHDKRDANHSIEVGPQPSREGYHSYTIPHVTDMRYQYPSTPSYITATINLDDVPR